MITSQITSQDDNSITIELTTRNNDVYMMTVVKAPGFTPEQLLERWTRRAKLEYMRHPVFFTKFVDRINLRHQKILSGEIEPVFPAVSEPATSAE